MQPEQVLTASQARAIVEERGLLHVKVGVFDNDGVLRGKYIDRDKFFAALEKGLGFCDVVLGWDSNDGCERAAEGAHIAESIASAAAQKDRVILHRLPCRGRFDCSPGRSPLETPSHRRAHGSDQRWHAAAGYRE
jgi:hypothetical protein